MTSTNFIVCNTVFDYPTAKLKKLFGFSLKMGNYIFLKEKEAPLLLPPLLGEGLEVLHYSGEISGVFFASIKKKKYLCKCLAIKKLNNGQMGKVKSDEFKIHKIS